MTHGAEHLICEMLQSFIKGFCLLAVQNQHLYMGESPAQAPKLLKVTCKEAWCRVAKEHFPFVMTVQKPVPFLSTNT